MTESPSPKPLGMSDFFALEAGEYLERLDGLLATGSNPSADEIVRLARALRGSALMANQHAIARTAAGIRVSLFIDPDAGTIDRAAALRVPAVELHTGRYARSWRKSDAALRALERAAAHARARGLAVHAGHGLTYDNVQPVAAIRDIEELNIGHSIVSNAIFVGMEAAVRRMRQLVDEARKP